MPPASQSPYSIIVYSMTNKTIDPTFVTVGPICNFRYPNLVIFYFYELTNLKLNEELLLYTYSTNILVCLLTINMKN